VDPHQAVMRGSEGNQRLHTMEYPPPVVVVEVAEEVREEPGAPAVDDDLQLHRAL